jgi:hypothetical protein
MIAHVHSRPLKIAYGVVLVSFATALAHFFPIADAHEALLAASFIPGVVCMVLGLQVQPREMRPALFAFLGIWVHAACFVLSDHFGWVIRF